MLLGRSGTIIATAPFYGGIQRDKTTVIPIWLLFSAAATHSTLFGSVSLMASSLASSLSTIQRQCCCLSLRSLSSRKPRPSLYHCYRHFNKGPLKKRIFSLTLSRNFSQSHLSKNTQGPGLHHFVAQATSSASASASASQTQPSEFLFIFLKRFWTKLNFDVYF